MSITDNDDPPTIDLGDKTVNENDEVAEVRYTLSSKSGQDVHFTWWTQNDTATGGEDYTALTGQTGTIPEGHTEGVLQIP